MSQQHLFNKFDKAIDFGVTIGIFLRKHGKLIGGILATIIILALFIPIQVLYGIFKGVKDGR